MKQRYTIYALFLLSLFVSISASAQIKGVITDSLTNEPLMYITVQYEGKGVGGISNANGEYQVETRKGWDELTFSAVGYITKKVKLKPGTRVLNVKLQSDDIMLSEVVVKPQKEKYSRKNNPAVEFMKKVIENKKALKLEENDYYQYQKYEKMKMSLNDVTPDKMEKGIYKKFSFFKDQVEVSPKTNKMILPISIKETASKTIFRKSPKSEKTIIEGMNSTGIEEFFNTGDMLGTILTDVFSDINIYDDDIRLLQRRFVSPIGRGAISFYKYYLMDTLMVDRQECVHLTFVPQNPQDFGFTGHLLSLIHIYGELTSAGAYTRTFREQGRAIVAAIPLYDENQRRFESTKSAEKKALKAIQQIANGEFEDWKIDAIKAEKCRQFDLEMESNEDKAMILMNAFYNEQDLGDILNYKDKIMAITTDDIKRVAKKYLSDNYLALYIEKGKPDKNAKIEKPGYKPVEPPIGKESLYATQFKNLPIGQMEEKFADYGEVQIKQLNDRSKMYYTPNKENNVFQLVVQYGAGEREFPKLGYAAQLMNNAGIMGAYEPQELKEELSKLNATCHVTADDDNLYIIMEGYEATLPQACQLLSRQILMPKLDEKQLARLKGSAMGMRQQRKDNVSILNEALRQYMLYGEKSDYIKELTDKEIYELQISELTGDINRASNYEAKVFFTGTLPFDQVYDILSKNLPLVANERPSNSPQAKDMMPVTENTVYFLPNNDAEQAQIHLYIPMQKADKKDDVLRSAFNQYFGLDFTGIVLNEIREKRSMAYTAYAFVGTQGIAGKASYLRGYIGTQNDKANDALDVLMGLVNDMPKNPERIDNIKSYLRQAMLTSHPSFRNKAMELVDLGYRGYTDDPAKENLPKVDALTFDDIVKFYEENIKDKPYCISIMGNPKNIDLKRLEKFGKVVKLNERKLFNTKDALF